MYCEGPTRGSETDKSGELDDCNALHPLISLRNEKPDKRNMATMYFFSYDSFDALRNEKQEERLDKN